MRVPAPATAPVAAVTEVATTVLDGVGPLEWNAALDRDRATLHGVPAWPAVLVRTAAGGESVFVFPSRADAPTVLGAWPPGARDEHRVRIFPGYRWIVVETPDPANPDPGRHARFYAANGALLYESTVASAPTPLGRDLVLWPLGYPEPNGLPRLAVRRLPEAADRESWLAVMGFGAASPLENFGAANTVGLLDPATGLRTDELRLFDLEGHVLWNRALAADEHEFAVSDQGDVAIAREGSVLVFDRNGTERFREKLPGTGVGRTAISPDGRFLLVAARAAAGRQGRASLWLALYDTRRLGSVWMRADWGDATDALEISVADDGGRALVRLSGGGVHLLGGDGSTVVTWNSPEIPGGEFAPGITPRRTWLSPDGTLIAVTTPVAASLAEARGWVYRVER